MSHDETTTADDELTGEENGELGEHLDLVRIMAAEYPGSSEVHYQEGVLLRRLLLNGNYWQIRVDGETVACINAAQVASTLALKKQIEELIKHHRSGDDYNGAAYN